jgi:hypothetical protein
MSIAASVTAALLLALIILLAVDWIDRMLDS